MNVPSKVSIMTFVFGSAFLVLASVIIPTLLGVSWSKSFTDNTMILVITGIIIIGVVNLVVVPEMTRRREREKYGV